MIWLKRGKDRELVTFSIPLIKTSIDIPLPGRTAKGFAYSNDITWYLMTSLLTLQIDSISFKGKENRSALSLGRGDLSKQMWLCIRVNDHMIITWHYLWVKYIRPLLEPTNGRSRLINEQRFPDCQSNREITDSTPLLIGEYDLLSKGTSSKDNWNLSQNKLSLTVRLVTERVSSLPAKLDYRKIKLTLF